MNDKKKQVSCYLTEDEARILKESAYTQTDLIKQDICGFVIGNRDFYNEITQSKKTIKIINQQIEILEQNRVKEEQKIKLYNEKLKEFSFNDTEEALKAVEELNNVLRVNKERRFNIGVSGFGLNKVPLKIAESIAKNANVTLRYLLSNADEDLMVLELEGYSTLLKRWKVSSMHDLK